MFSNKKLLLKIFLFLVIIENGWTLYSLASIPADAKNAVLFGFSPPRLFLMGGISLVFGTVLFLLVCFFLSHQALGNAIKFLDGLLENEKRSLLVIIAAWLVFAAGVLFLLIPAARFGEALYQRVGPVVVFGLLLSLQALMFQFLWMKRTVSLDRLAEWKNALLPAGIALGVFILLWVFIGLTGIGIVPEKTGWFPPGTPVLPQQVLFAWMLGFIFFLAGMLPWFAKNLRKQDYILGSALWLAAGLMWWLEPLQRLSYFTSAPTPPNFESYPYSDSALYDIFAQNYLIGTSRAVGLTHRPLYSIFLALLHALVGQDFKAIAIAQVFILAVFPAALYLLVSRLGGRPAGLLAALIVIFRERNAIALTNVIEVSHSKLLMSDVPTMAVMILFLYFLVKWLQDRDNKIYLGAVAGAVLGFVMLVRSQAQLLVPATLLCILVAQKETWSSIVKKSLIFLLGVLIVVAPWVWRNYQVSGRALIEYQNFYTRIIASGYTDSMDDIERLSGETQQAYDDRMMSLIVNYIRDNPLEVARFYTAYFLHNEISSIVYLPMALKFFDARTYVRELGMWGWNPILGSPPAETLPIFFVALCMIALGIGVAYQRVKWIGLIPLLVHFIYSFSVVPFKASGWRFILPVDWVAGLYFSIGLMQASIILFALFSGKYLPTMIMDQDPYPRNGQLEHFSWRRTLSLVGIFLVMGLSIPLVEWMIPQKYPALAPRDLVQTYVINEVQLDDGSVVTKSDLKVFLEVESAAVVLRGRALYPSFYESGEFWGDDDSYPLELRNISRLQFQLIGPRQVTVFIPMLHSPSYFPHGSDVLIIGCETNAGIRAIAINVNTHADFISTLPWPGLTCSQ